ncbi:MAG: ribonuclease HII [Methylotenera sp.]|nr:ribonuclease HII [Oligoflexia bacterium]
MTAPPKSRKSKTLTQASPKKKMIKRPRPDVSYEREVGFELRIVAGVDEVGRGCLAGPVVAAAVILPKDPALYDKRKVSWLKKVTDSKLVDSDTRAELAPLIKAWARGWSVGQADVAEIDRINIHHASHLAMVRAITTLQHSAEHILVDGKFIPKDLPCPSTAIIKGDQKSLSIACASILAKVHRDEMMRAYDATYPGYSFGVHKGYGTPMHARAIQSLGICDIHRRSFAPVAQVVAALLQMDLPLAPRSSESPNFDDFEDEALAVTEDEEE